MGNQRKLKKVVAYILMPLLFAVVGYFLLYVVCLPILRPVISILDMVTTKDSPDFEQQPTYSQLFVPTESDPGGTTDLKEIAASQLTFPQYNTCYGEIEIAGTAVKAPLYYGDTPAILKRGAGQYIGSHFPGCGSTVLVGGHNNTYFHGLKDVEVGDRITLRTHYATYIYEVTDTSVKKNDDTSAYDLNSPEELLVLYTCYPFNMLGLTPHRYFVTAKLVSGPPVNLYQ